MERYLRRISGSQERSWITYDGVILEYSNLQTGGHTFPRPSCCIQLLRPGEKTQEHRHTSGAAYHVFRGSGRTIIETETLHWKEGDCFVLPPWYSHKHKTVPATMTLFCFH